MEGDIPPRRSSKICWDNSNRKAWGKTMLLTFFNFAFRRWLALVTLCVISCASTKTPTDVTPLVTIDSGIISGAHFGPATDEVMFLGIPYAAPPTGDRRWKSPAPVAAWTGVRKADAFAPACPQPASFVTGQANEAKELSQRLPYYGEFRTDEDCLYLNVWTTNLAAKKKLPVMVWIHGGGGFSGNSWTALGPSLAPKGVVVVSVGFRIGALGHLAHPALTEESEHHASGNYGTLDQIAALHWVQRNIAAFGGDPENVTIFGGSDGAQKVCNLMVSPLSRGLFHRAILESGVCSDKLVPELKKSIRYEGNEKGGTAEDTGITLARNLRISVGPNTLIELRSKTAEEIVQASPDLDLFSTPTVDGWVLPAQPAAAFREGRQASVPVLVGSTNDEMASLYNPPDDPTTVASYRAWLNGTRFSSNADSIFQLYPASTDAEVPTAFMTLETDDFAAGAYFLARQTAHIGQKAYLYYFTYPSKGKMAGRGATHCAEVKFLLGDFRRSSWGEWNDEDRKLTETVIGYWTRFAATGNPNGPTVPEWPSYDERTDLRLAFGHEVRSRAVPNLEKYKLIERSLGARLAELKP
jgi:para-nitrobenzyl esterase